MLSRSYKTAAELGLRSHEFDALWEVVHNFEDGTLLPERINLVCWCGTNQCMAGWAHEYDHLAFPEVADMRLPYPQVSEHAMEAYKQMRDRIPQRLHNIFMWINNSPDKSIASLRHYLETGN